MEISILPFERRDTVRKVHRTIRFQKAMNRVRRIVRTVSAYALAIFVITLGLVAYTHFILKVHAEMTAPAPSVNQVEQFCDQTVADHASKGTVLPTDVKNICQPYL